MPFFLFWGCKSPQVGFDACVQYGDEKIDSLNVAIDTIEISTISPYFKDDFSIATIPYGMNRWVKAPVIHQGKVLVNYMKVNDDIRCLWLNGDGLVSQTSDSLNYAIIDQKLYGIGLNHKLLYQIPQFNRIQKKGGRNYYVANEIGYKLQPSILPLNGSLYYPISAYGVKFGNRKSRYGIGRFKLNDFVFEEVKIPFPSFLDISHVGFSNKFYLSPFKDNKLLVTYALKPIGLIYNPETKLIEDTISYKSVYDTLELQTFERETDVVERMWKTILYDGSYRGFVYNPFKKHYYCVYQVGQPENRPDGLKNTLEDRRTAFIILNQKLQVIYDCLLPGIIKNGSRIIPHKDGGIFLAPLSEEDSRNKSKAALEVDISYE